MGAEKRSAGLMMFRRAGEGIEVFLIHPGGPFFDKKDEGAWSIPKGESGPGENPLEVAKHEFQEETGQAFETCARTGSLIPLGSVRQPGGKTVEAWAFEGDWPAGAILRSNTFSIEWPPRSGGTRDFPEVDRGEFFPVTTARGKINPAQSKLIERLLERLEPRATKP